MTIGFDPAKYPGPDPNGWVSGWSMLSNAITEVGARKQQRELAAAQQAHAGAMQRANQSAINKRFDATQEANKAAAKAKRDRENEVNAAKFGADAYKAEAGGLPDDARAAEMAGRPYGFRAERVYAAPQDAGNQLPQRPTTSAEMAPNGVNAPVDSALQSLMAQDQPPAQPGMAPAAPVPVPQEPISVRYSGPGGQPLGDLDLRKALQARIAQAEAATSGYEQSVAPFGDPGLSKTVKGIGEKAPRAVAAGTATPGAASAQAEKDRALAAQGWRSKSGIGMQGERLNAAGVRGDSIDDRALFQVYNRQLTATAQPVVQSTIGLEKRLAIFKALPPNRRAGMAQALAVSIARASGESGALAIADVAPYLSDPKYISYLQAIDSWYQKKGEGQLPQIVIDNLEAVANGVAQASRETLGEMHADAQAAVGGQPWATDLWRTRAQNRVNDVFAPLANKGRDKGPPSARTRRPGAAAPPSPQGNAAPPRVEPDATGDGELPFDPDDVAGDL